MTHVMKTHKTYKDILLKSIIIYYKSIKKRQKYIEFDKKTKKKTVSLIKLKKNLQIIITML